MRGLMRGFAAAAMAAALLTPLGPVHAQGEEKLPIQVEGSEYRALSHAVAFHASLPNAGICEALQLFYENGEIRVSISNRVTIELDQDPPPLTCKRPMLYTYDLEGNFLGRYAQR